MDEFGDIPADPAVKNIKMMLPLRPLNMIEHELNTRFTEELMIVDAPVPFVDDDGSLENADDNMKKYGRDLNLDEVMTMRSLIETELLERYRRQLIIARELGDQTHDGHPTLEEYRAACALENVEPLL